MARSPISDFVDKDHPKYVILKRLNIRSPKICDLKYLNQIMMLKIKSLCLVVRNIGERL